MAPEEVAADDGRKSPSAVRGLQRKGVAVRGRVVCEEREIAAFSI